MLATNNLSVSSLKPSEIPLSTVPSSLENSCLPHIRYSPEYPKFKVPEKIKKFRCEIVEKRGMMSKDGVNGRWSKQESERFIEALNKFGKNWKKVEAYVETRSSTQIRSHAQKYFLKHTLKPMVKPIEHDSDSGNPSVNTGITPEKPFLILQNATKEVTKSSNLELVLTRIKRLEERTSLILIQCLNVAESAENKFILQQELVNISEETFNILRKTEESKDVAERCLNIIRNSNFGILEIAKVLKSTRGATTETDCKFLLQHLQPYGFFTFQQVFNQYSKLDEWVDIGVRRQWNIPRSIAS